MIENVSYGNARDPELREQLVNALTSRDDLTGSLTTDWPIYETGVGKQSLDALLISGDEQVTLIDAVTGADPGDYQRRQDKIYWTILQIQPRTSIQTVTFAPGASRSETEDSAHPLANSAEDLAEIIRRAQRENPGQADPDLVFLSIGAAKSG